MNGDENVVIDTAGTRKVEMPLDRGLFNRSPELLSSSVDLERSTPRATSVALSKTTPTSLADAIWIGRSSEDADLCWSADQ